MKFEEWIYTGFDLRFNYRIKDGPGDNCNARCADEIKK